ncbi:hypothetical protein K443DRAFT_14520 [Laccaria amethystina LaAM-08-1]|uniref:Uncharacterized protein n=1 Tax=Laccaria amethystina LaAM-08-1 TaxID=1095629 RepID=A0A0C9X141_9AGAR|nr:hypothetical protein K443DRAFT_14520 [Laccaria amethystina LaAM-08-1]
MDPDPGHSPLIIIAMGHDRPTHTLHLLPEERHRFDAIVSAHPGIGPLRLIVGVPGINGPGESVADISDVLLNADCVSKEKQKIKKTKTQGGDGPSWLCDLLSNGTYYNDMSPDCIYGISTPQR